MKVITIRLTDEEYELIAAAAQAEYRPISNYITASIIRIIGEEAGNLAEESIAQYGDTQSDKREGNKKQFKIITPKKRASMRSLLGKAKGVIPKGKSSTEYIRELRSTLYGKIK